MAKEKESRWRVKFEFGKHGSKFGELNDPNDLAICQNGSIAAANPGNKCVVIFSLVGLKYKSSQILTMTEEDNDHQPYRPQYLTITPQHNILIISNSGIFNVYNEYGSHLYNYSNPSYGRSWGVTVDTKGLIYVIHGTETIAVYSEDRNGNKLQMIESIKVQRFNGTLYGRLAVTSSGLIILNVQRDGYNEMIAIAQNGQVKFSISPQIKGEKTSQHGVVVDGKDNIFIVVRGSGSAHIHQYNSKGVFLRCRFKMKNKSKSPIALAFKADGLPFVLCNSELLMLY